MIFYTGKFGPLDRLRTIIDMIREDYGAAGRTFPLGQHLGGLLGGMFVPLPNDAMELDAEMMQRVSAVMLLIRRANTDI